MSDIKPYLSIPEVVARTVWTEDAVRTMMKRNQFVRGVHYFQPCGPGSRVLFKWAAVVEFIERGSLADPTNDVIPFADGSRVRVSRS